ncbi:MAG: hypothetical protein AB7T49_14205 [Oligoflexales bacterium]
MSLTDDEIQTFATPLLEYLPEEVKSHGGVVCAMEAHIESLDKLASPEACNRRQNLLAPGQPAENLAERIVRLTGKKVGIIGIRFKQLNPNYPFCQLQLNFTPSLAEIETIKAIARRQFHSFSLKGMLIRQSPQFNAGQAQKWSHTVWGHTKVEEVELPKVDLSWEKSVNFYAEYAREFEAFLCDNESKRSFLRMESEADLNEAAEARLLLSIGDQSGWAGVIAGEVKSYHGYPCLYIFELFLCKRLRGQKLARPLEAYFLRSLSNRFERVFGHIDDANQPSLRTAFSLGRSIIESEFFIPLDNT